MTDKIMTDKYQVGDIVYVLCRIKEIRPEETFKYIVDLMSSKNDTDIFIEDQISGIAYRPMQEQKSKYSIGDRVIHLYKPEWGIGIIQEVVMPHEPINLYDFYDHSTNPSDKLINSCYMVKYAKKSAFVLMSGTWRTAEENLVDTGE